MLDNKTSCYVSHTTDLKELPLYSSNKKKPIFRLFLKWGGKSYVHIVLETIIREQLEGLNVNKTGQTEEEALVKKFAMKWDL